ncbi:beta-lactamase/transpeptidase-like protein [Mollisia scopiformis]|uniref:Beta-lactamase/transpeptidase-like protein n=1 Tax=Mollisia scopiformis TaxID=149040 RepID=A0A194XMD9_MOLSC|nr:beta-lactamase/transpeptidase-like protein [Mollisia scopiformis]KUJ21343.1 beta-lactamase/transpeptidase-like protein [Mollisia scopiformis]
MKGTVELLSLLGSTIKDICASSGTPGLSLGVLHHSAVLFRENYGYRDVEARQKPDSDTIYGTASLTKAFTSSLLGIFVDEGKIAWDTPLHDVLPDFLRNDEINSATIVDVLGQRTGLAKGNNYWFGNDNGLLLEQCQAVPIVNYLTAIEPFRASRSSNNWHYALAGQVVDDRILTPLGLKRTVFWNDLNQENVAKPYVALDDGSSYSIPYPKLADGTLMGSAMGLRSSVNDLLTWSKALLDGLADQRHSGLTSTNGLPLKQPKTIMDGKSPLSSSYPGKMGLGWMLTTTPSKIGGGGANAMLLEEMPNVGEDSPGIELIYYQGSTSGYTTSLLLVPETQSAIIVLANSMGLNDAADWVSQAVLEVLLNTTKPADHAALSRETAKKQVSTFPSMNQTLQKDRTLGTSPRELGKYVGAYYNSIKNFFIETCIEDGELHFAFQGLRDHQSWPLKHYNYDTFSWIISRDECVKRARFAAASPGLYLLEFVHSEDNIVALQWKHDPGFKQPEEFTKASKPYGNGGLSQIPLAIL